MTSANAMRLKLLLKDDHLLQQQLSQCDSADQVIEIAAKLQLDLCMPDLLRMEALMTLTLNDDQLEGWYSTPYWKRVLISLGAMPEQFSTLNQAGSDAHSTLDISCQPIAKSCSNINVYTNYLTTAIQQW